MVDRCDMAALPGGSVAEPGDASAATPRDVAAALDWLDARPVPGGPAEVALIVAERFGVVNAAYGRRIGDLLLAAMATRLERVAGEGALSARIGGGAFLVAGTAGLGDRVSAALARAFLIEGRSIPVGVAQAHAARIAGEPARTLLARLFPAAGLPRADAVLEEEDALAADLHRAVERGEVGMLFQPQVCLRSGRIVGVEALARWDHPRLGTLGAEPLFAAAARGGLAQALSEHVQLLALRRAAGWRGRLAGLRLSVNVTADDLAATGFAQRLLGHVAASGFPPGRLTVEVTEGGLIAELDAAAATLARLRAAGCRVALDDFGTGYSSLAWLRALPVDAIKLDKAITRDVTGSARDRAVLDGVVGIARRLGLETVAEGVETAGQRDLLAAAGCDTYQGFLCAEALDVPALAALVEGQDA